MPKPVGIFPLDYENGIHDISSSGIRSGIMVGVASAPGPRGEAQGSTHFVSNHSFVELFNNGGLDTKKSITISLWLYLEAFSGNIFGFYGKQWTAVSLFLQNEVLGLSVYPKNAYYSRTPPLPGAKMSLKTWYYVSVVYDFESGMASLWMDGQKKPNTISVGSFKLATKHNIRLGGSRFVGLDGVPVLKGRMSCFQVYDVALSEFHINKAKNTCWNKGKGDLQK